VSAREGSASLATAARDDAAESLWRGNRLLVLALLATLILWNIPYGWVALYPFKIFATWLHESSHGLVMLVTGAGLEHLRIYQDTSGLAVSAWKVGPTARFAFASAGYMGTALFGALFLVVGRTPRGARRVLGAIGVLMLLSAAAYVRNWFGGVAIAAGGAALVALAIWGTDGMCGFIVSFLAAQSCINAVLDIRVLFAAKLYVNGREYAGSDAHSVAAVAGGPPWLWAALWLVWSFGLFYVALRWVRLRADRAG
jgi:hypothetical protein